MGNRSGGRPTHVVNSMVGAIRGPMVRWPYSRRQASARVSVCDACWQRRQWFASVCNVLFNGDAIGHVLLGVQCLGVCAWAAARIAARS